MPLDICIDVSDNNPTIDWAQVYASGIRVAMIKALQGVGPTYPSWKSQSAAALAAGLAVIPYWFLQPANSVTAFVAQTGLTKGSVYSLDWEGRANQTATPENVEGIGTALATLTGRVPLGYWGEPGSTPDTPTPTMQRWDRWIPRYPQVPQPQSFAQLHPSSLTKQPVRALFWQYTSAGKVPGIPGPVDRSVWLGTMDELTAWLATGAHPAA